MLLKHTSNENAAWVEDTIEWAMIQYKYDLNEGGRTHLLGCRIPNPGGRKAGTNRILGDVVAPGSQTLWRQGVPEDGPWHALTHGLRGPQVEDRFCTGGAGH